MDVFVTRQVTEHGGLFRPPSLSFVLAFEVQFSAAERWAIERHRLYEHVILDRTPQWYAGALADALKHENERDWPSHLPRKVPQEWRLTVRQLLATPTYIVTFGSAEELDEFAPRAREAFRHFTSFLRRYAGSDTALWRL